MESPSSNPIMADSRTDATSAKETQYQIWDIHCHIIPGVDDGAKTIEESLQMVEAQYSQGIRRIIATPHYAFWNKKYQTEKAQASFGQLKEEAEARHPDLKLFMGNEIFYASNTVEELKSGKALTLAGTNMVLLEFSPFALYSTITLAINDLRQNGFIPVIAHVERYKAVFNGNCFDDLVSRGALLQVNCEVFKGGFLKPKPEKLISQLDVGNISFLATDCHNMLKRQPDLKPALKKLAKKISKDKIVEIICPSDFTAN